MPHVLTLSSALGNIGKALTHLQFAMSDSERGVEIKEHWLENAAKELGEAVQEVAQARGELKGYRSGRKLTDRLGQMEERLGVVEKRLEYDDRDPFADDGREYNPADDGPPMFCHPDPDKTFDEIIAETCAEQFVKAAGNGRHTVPAAGTA